MKKRILLSFLVISFVYFIFSVYSLLHESKAKALSEAFIEETYAGSCHDNLNAVIYGKEDGFYAVSVRPTNDVSKTFYLQIKLSMWFEIEEILDASEYNLIYACEEDQHV